MKKIRTKILLSFLITSSIFILSIGGYSFFTLLNLNNNQALVMNEMLFDDYDKMIKGQVESAESIVNTYYNYYKDGTMSESDAKEAAKKVIKEIRYNVDGYFWIDGTDGMLIAHPISPDQEGTNRINIEDPNGVKLIEEIINTSKRSEKSGFTNFMWAKSSSSGEEQVTPKRAYSKLFQPWNWIISTGNYVDDINLAVENKREELNKSLIENVIAMGVLVVIALIAMTIVGIFISGKISKPIIKIVKAFEKDSNGQISIKKLEIKDKDELGLLANTLNILQEQIKDFIEGVVSEADKVNKAANTVEKDMIILNNSIEEVSATTEEVSAGMEETAASTEEASNTASSITIDVEGVLKKANEGVTIVKEISSRADNLKSTLNTTFKNGEVILNEAEKNLKGALEEAKAVNKINELADAILDITEQTDLLALNAAIEASRAGDAGKGFTVVAEEIRKLAEDSKNTASKIQDVIKIIVGSVDNLSNNSIKILQFINTNVKEDYNFMLKASDDYDEDAKVLYALVSSYNSTSEQLLISIKNMMKAMDDITKATTEGATGTNSIAERSMVISENLHNLLAQASKSKESSEALKTLVLKFKI